MRTPTSRLCTLGAFLAVTLAGCSEAAEEPFAPDFGVSSSQSGPNAFEVYTQNLFLGGDTGPLLSIDFNDIGAILAAAGVFWADVEASNFPDRAVAIVDEIEAQMPHVVALQEVLQFVLLNASFQPVGGLDLLGEIEAEIAARGLPYKTEVVQNNTSSTLPLAADASGITTYLNFTDRIATMRRTDVELVAVDQGEYVARFNVGPVELKRGWARMSVRHAGTTYHHLNTHLEIQQLAPVQIGQTAELIQSVLPSFGEGVTVISGDLNSNAAAMPGDPTWTPTYGNLIADGFTDVWNQAPPANRDVGLTCCHDKSLTGNLPFDQRIDFVLVRNSDTAPNGRGLFDAEIVGEEDADRTDSGLWPSDHAGLVGRVMNPGPVH